MAGLVRENEATMREHDTVGRLGGDEFAILAQDSDLDTARLLAERVIDTLAAPFPLVGGQVTIRASVGIATDERLAFDEVQLLRNADIAMYAAKSRGKGTYEVFQGSMLRSVRDRHDSTAALEARSNATSWWSTTSRSSTCTTDGWPVPRRWCAGHGPTAGWCRRPSSSRWPRRPAWWSSWTGSCCARPAASWPAGTPTPARCCCTSTLSAHHLLRNDLAANVGAALRGSGLPPDCLALEITESVLMHDLEVAIVLAATLHLATVAEGVEQPEQAAALAELGCHLAQGYHFSRPVPAADMARLTRERPAAGLRHPGLSHRPEQPAEPLARGGSPGWEGSRPA
jgi:predicted signal transduction protein with EAL and GGDEF domain